MFSITFKDIQARTEDLKIEFDIVLGIGFDNDDLAIDQFNLQVRVKPDPGAWKHIGSRWEAKIAFRGSSEDIPVINVPGAPGSQTYTTEIWNLPENLEDSLGIEQARRVRAVCAVNEYFSLANVYPRTSYKETIYPRDAQERDIRITMPPIEIEMGNERKEYLNMRKYLDILSLHNLKWDFEAVLASSETRASDVAVYRRDVPLVFEGKIIEEEVDELQLPNGWFGRVA